MPHSLSVLNLSEATFECTFGRGCDGTCCRNGRPPISVAEAVRIKRNLGKFLPALRPEARSLVQSGGFLSRRRKSGKPMLRVLDGWCVFFNQGCVLHKVGAVEGNWYRYKPAPCALFPLQKDDRGRWYVRQHGYKGERWDLFCLAPGRSFVHAVQSLQEELALASKTTRVGLVANGGQRLYLTLGRS